MRKVLLTFLSITLLLLSARAQSSSVVVRVMAANITSGTNQRYEAPGIRTFQGLDPDVVAIQEFNYASTTGKGINTPAAIREFVDIAFGTNFVFFRESGTGYTIPNGVISRYPILAAGSWEDSDTGVNDRGFTWTQLDVPGTNDLFVVSVHLKASSGSSNATRRQAQAEEIKSLIQSSFTSNSWLVVAGDFNIHSESEGAVTVLSSFLSDSPIPTDAPIGGDPDTNASRTERYDRVWTSFSFTNNLAHVTLPSRTFSNGLVFDSRVYTPLSDVTPVLSGDSGVSGMQHMAVMRSYQITISTTNSPPTEPVLRLPALGVNQVFTFQLTGTPGANYVIEVAHSPHANNWQPLVTNTAPFEYHETNNGAYDQRFYRARYVE